MDPHLGGDVLVPEAGLFPEMMQQLPVSTGFARTSSTIYQEDSSSESAEAPLRPRHRVRKGLPRDDAIELRNADLAHWNNDYITNMMAEDRAKLHRRASRLAKKNAQFWVYGSGIGHTGSSFGNVTFQSPLDMFAGDALMQTLTGIANPVAGRKRSRDGESQGSDSEARRVRPRDIQEEHGSRGAQLPVDDEAMAIFGGEVNFGHFGFQTMLSYQQDIEFGREAQPVLEDQSFPWNVSTGLGGSRPGSVVRGHGIPSSAGGFTASAGRPSSVSAVGGVPSSLDRRISRIPSASPLVGRGPQRYSSLELPVHGDDDELLGGQDITMSNAEEEFQLYGPVAGVSTQVANFLEFVKTDIAGKIIDGDEDAQQSVLFEDLLPVSQHSKIVAAEAFHHVLALATKGLIDVQQDLAFGPITLGLPFGGVD